MASGASTGAGYFRRTDFTRKRRVPYPAGMVTNREIKTRERKVERLAQAETNIVERLIGLRGDVDTLSRVLDRLTVCSPPRMHAGGNRSGLSNLVPFNRRGRP